MFQFKKPHFGAERKTSPLRRTTVLGPGDEVVIDIWGVSEDHLRSTISPEGSIMIAQLGPIYLNGMTINQANDHIRSAFSSKYSGVDNEATDIAVTLGQMRTIQGKHRG